MYLHLFACIYIYLLNALNMPGIRLRAVDTMMTPYVIFHKLPGSNWAKGERGSQAGDLPKVTWGKLAGTELAPL